MKLVQPMQTKAQSAALLKLALAEKYGTTPYATRLRQEAALLLGADAAPTDPTRPIDPTRNENDLSSFSEDGKALSLDFNTRPGA